MPKKRSSRVPQAPSFLTKAVAERSGESRTLRESEEKFRLLAEHVAEVFWLLDPKDYQVLYVSPAYEELWGRTCESLYEDPRSWLADIHPADLERVSSALEKQAETGEFDEEFRLTPSDGSIRWVWDRGFAVKDKSGQVQRVVGLAYDITERKQAEALLADQTSILETLAKGAPLEEVLTTIVEMVEGRAQGMLCSVLLLNKEEGLLRPGVAPSLPDSFNQAIAQGIPIGPIAGSCGTAAYRAEPVISSDIASDPIWAQYKELAVSHELRACWSTPIFSSKREVLGTFAMYYHEPRSPGEHELRLIEVATHIAGIAIEHQLAEEALRASEERFRHLYTATPAMLHSIDPDGRIVSVSDYWLEVLGYDRGEVIGRKSVEFLTEESRRDAEEVVLPEFWKRGAARDVGYQFVRKDGEIVDILLSAIVERDKDGNPYRTLAVLTDVTEQKRLEEQLQNAREELEGKVERQMVRKNPYGLTFRELTILHPLAAGRADKEIAAELVISPLTVQKHVSNILGKMDASSRTEAATRALREGLLD